MNPRDLAIIGIGETPHARHIDGSLSSLCIDAVLAAAEDAGIDPQSIDGIVTDNLHMPEVTYDMVPALNLASDIFVAHSGSSGAGTMASPLMAQLAIDAGLATTVVCYFGSKYGSQAGGVYSHHGNDPYKQNFEMPYGFFPQAVYMASMASLYLHQYNYSVEDLAHVAMSMRAWAALHPDATKREPMDLDAYFKSPLVSDPFRNVDCSLISDGAAAFIMTKRDRALDGPHPPVFVRGCARRIEPISEHDYQAVRDDLLSLPSRLSGPAAFADAGLGVEDIDFVELYDCFSIVPVIQLEDLGFYPRGTALSAFVKGETAPGGSRPVNTHGGLLSHSYLLGVSHLCEAVKQLRGDAGARQLERAKTGLVTGWGSSEHTTLILGNEA